MKMCRFLKSGQMVIGNTNLIYKSMDGTARILDPNVFNKNYVENKRYFESDVNVDTLIDSGVYRMRRCQGQPSNFINSSGNLLTLRAGTGSTSLTQLIFDYPKDGTTRPLFSYRNIQTTTEDTSTAANISPWNMVLSNQITVLPNNANIITDINGCGLYCGHNLVNAPSTEWWYFLVFEYYHAPLDRTCRRYIAFSLFTTTSIYTVNYDSKTATDEAVFGIANNKLNAWIPLVSWS